MAHTQFEKDMLNRIREEIENRKRVGKATSDDLTDLETITTGTEAERQSLIATYINDVGIPRCNVEIADCDAAKSVVQALKTDMEAYVA